MPHTLKGLPQHLLGKECGLPNRKRDSGLGSQPGKAGTWGEGRRGGYSKGIQVKSLLQEEGMAFYQCTVGT